MERKQVLLGLIFLLCGANVFSQTAYDQKLKSLYNNTVPLVRPQQLSDEMKAGRSVVILDTRSKEEFETSHIKGARFIDYDSYVEEEFSNLNKNSEIVVYCTVGYRSERVGEQLEKMGFTRVKNLYGGILQWANEGFPVVNKTGLTDSVHTYSKKWSVWLTRGIKVY